MFRQEKWQNLLKELEKAGVFEDDIVEKFLLGSGPGGQKVNKTHSTVYIKHIPTGIEVKCQKTRSREMNRFHARRILLEKYREKILKIETEKKRQEQKIKAQKKRRSRRLQKKILEEKRERSKTKELRKPPKAEE